MEHFLERATQIQDEIIRNRRQIHQNAEVGMDLPITVSFVLDKLRSYGYEPQVLGGGVACTVGKPGKTILLRADMDALVQTEASGAEYACTSGACHSCGHDAHTAMLLAAARMLKEQETELAGTVKFMFQPGEEYILGAKAMIDAGILESPKPDAAMAIHVAFGGNLYKDASTGEPVERASKTIVYTSGPASMGSYQFRVRVKGRSSHGAEPNKGRSAISAACNMVVALQQIISMEVGCKDAATMTICTFNGGTTHNILCDDVVFTGTMRTFDMALLEYLHDRFTTTCECVAKAFDMEAVVEYPFRLPCVYNDPEFSAEMAAYAQEICGPGHRVEANPGGEDFSWITEKVGKGFFMYLCTGSEREGYLYPAHDPRMTIDEDALRYGAACLAHCAARWLRNSSR